MSLADPALARRARRGGKSAAAPSPSLSLQGAGAALPSGWREFVGHWLESSGCIVSDAARGDWEVELSPALKRRWRRQRVRLVFDPQRPTLPRGAWFTAPGSGAGRRLLEAALEEPMTTMRTALAHVPGAPENGIASVCRVRGLTWGPARLGPVRYERRVAFHAVVTRWGGRPAQDSWVVLIGEDGACLEWAPNLHLPDVRPREGPYGIGGPLDTERRGRWMEHAARVFDALLDQREEEWERSIARLRDDELDRLGAFYSARIEEEEERLRRRTTATDEADLAHGDATTLKLEWERRAAEVRQRWAIRTEVRLWGIEEWSWPIADLEQELRAGAVHVRLTSRVDVARGRPALPACPGCGEPAELLVRARGSIVCASCG